MNKDPGENVYWNDDVEPVAAPKTSWMPHLNAVITREPIELAPAGTEMDEQRLKKSPTLRR
jgi:hypothetical protein